MKTPTRILTLAAFVFTAASAHADLHAVGHEFRPTAEEQAGTNPCTASDGVTASLVFVCNEPHGSGCATPYGKLFAQWRTAGGDLLAEPLLVAEGAYNYPVPNSCSHDGAILLAIDGKARVVDRNGPRGPDSSICGSGYCWGPFGISASHDGFLVVWPQYRHGLFGRFFDQNGKAVSVSFLIDGLPSDESFHAKGLLLPNADVLFAWKTRNPSTVRAAIVASDRSIVPAITVSEYPYIDFLSPLTVGFDGNDRILVAWANHPEQAGWVARRVLASDSAPTTTTSTTSTTLEPETVFLPAKELGTPLIGDDRYLTDAPALAGDESGRWFAAWPDHVASEGGGTLGLVSSFSLDQARNWSAPQTFQAERYPASLASSIGSDSSGVVIGAWSRGDGGAVFFRRSTDGGQSWSETASIYTAEYLPEEYWGSSSISQLTVAAGPDGRWVAAWTELIQDYRWCPEVDDDCIDYIEFTVLCAIRYAVSIDGGLTWAGAQTLEDGICWSDSNLEMAGDGSGNWLVVWSDWRDDAIHGAHSFDNGLTWSLPRTLRSGVEIDSSSLAVASSRDGHWSMVFSQWIPDPATAWPNTHARIFVSRTGDLSGDWSPPVGIATWHDSLDGADLFPSITAGEAGELGVAWSSHSANTGLDADLVAAFSSDSGATWSRPRTVDTEAGGDARKDLSPRILRAGSSWAVIWRTLEFSQQRTIRFARTRGDCGNGLDDPAEQCDDGNLVEGDGCDSTCLPTGCGSQVVTGGEECDDGNLDETDACLSCRAAFCGDGVVWSGLEECDDGNSIETDACLNDCMIARCGDGVVRPALEACDDGEASGNNDGCLTDCTVAACGDGYLRLGKEECDDGNRDDGDGCTKQCRMDPDCGFFTSDGLRVTATDALKVLRRAVGITSRCPMRSCDRNGDGNITAMDALWTLRSALELFSEGCVLPSALRLRLMSNEKLGSLQVLIHYIDAAGHVVAKKDGSPACTIAAPSALSALNWNAQQGELRLGLASLHGFQGPLDLLTCAYDPVSGPALHDFRVTIQEASGLDSRPVEPPPTVVLTAE